jgi:hypothetical protein
MNAYFVTTTAAYEHCEVFSVGGNDNWKFEKAVRKEMGFVTQTFDCKYILGNLETSQNMIMSISLIAVSTEKATS